MLAVGFRWLARLLSVVALAFVVFMAVGEGFPVRPTTREMVFLAIFATGLLANVIAWRWEVGGALVALLALVGLIAAQRATNGQLPGSWFFALLGLPAVCFLLAKGIQRPGRAA